MSKLLFFVFAAIVCAAIGLMVQDKKRYLLFLTIFFAPLRSGLIFFHYNGIMLMDFPLTLLLLSGIFSAGRFRFYFRRISIPIFGLLLWTLVSGFFALRADWAFSEWTRLLRGVIVFVCMANMIKTRKDVETAVYALMAGFFLESLIGVLQWRFGYLGLWFLDETLRSRWRSQATFVHPVVFSTYLAFMIPLFFRLFAFSRRIDSKMRFIYGIVLLTGMIAVFATRGRGAWLSVAVAVFLMVLLSIPRKKLRPRVAWPLGLMLMFGIAFSLRYGGYIFERIMKASSEEDRSATLRMPLNKIALQVIRDYPVFGTGQENYLFVVPDYIVLDGKFSYKQLWQEVHNVYLMIAAESGIPALIFFLWFIYFIFKMAKRARKSKDPHLANLGMGITFSYVAILIAFMGTPDYRVHQILILFWLMAGLLLAIGRVDARMIAAARKRALFEQKMKLNVESQIHNS